MKQLAFFIICSIIFFTSCDKVFLDVSGKEADLQGKWQMDNADTVFFNFQKNLFQYQVYNGSTLGTSYGYYTLHGDTAIDIKLLREFSRISLDHLGWDTIQAPIRGQDTIFRAFTIEKLDSKKLILSAKGEKSSFHKF